MSVHVRLACIMWNEFRSSSPNLLIVLVTKGCCILSNGFSVSIFLSFCITLIDFHLVNHSVFRK